MFKIPALSLSVIFLASPFWHKVPLSCLRAFMKLWMVMPRYQRLPPPMQKILSTTIAHQPLPRRFLTKR